MSQLDLQFDQQEEGTDLIPSTEPILDRFDREFVGEISEGSGSALRSKKLGGKCEESFGLNAAF
ncbi:MAG: hypothetical protein HN867_14185 [Deltaproteobacteria bacterium]|nr:hypothetical protein [Deltaproteobacteria bacterium]MBT7204612.1 hypothetical protein [Deltaproteobacteria bacterium]